MTAGKHSDSIAIIGGGYSGTMLAVRLARAGVARITLIERRPVAGRGAAYSTTLDDHLLNVRARNMSALAEETEHFAGWLGARGLGGPDDYAPRKVYGDYLISLLDGVRGQVTVVTGEAVDLVPASDGVTIALADGTAITASHAVLALGNLPPALPGMLKGLGPDVLRGDPWAEPLFDDLPPDGNVLLVGTGLTMIDAAITLDRMGFDGTIHAISRRGLAPRPHVHGQGAVPPPPALAGLSGAKLVHAVRKMAASDESWRSAVDSLRPVTQGLWRQADRRTQRQFLRHIRPWWDVHRHRIAPEIAARIQAMVDAGRLKIQAGRLLSAEDDGRQAVIQWRPRGAAGAEAMRVDRVVNCTGPEADIARSPDPLIRAALARGLIRADALGIGIDVDDDWRAVDASGTAQDRISIAGPMTRGALWEIAAVPDLRHQVAELAKRLAGPR